MTTDTPLWRITKFDSALLEHDGETCNEIHCASHDEAECLVDLLNELTQRTERAEAEVERLRAIIAQLIHYPECWDTACYETMDDAIHEIGNLRDCFDCQCDQCEFNNQTNK